MDSRGVNIEVEGPWKAEERGSVSRFMRNCFLSTMSVPLSLGLSSPLMFIVYPASGYLLVNTSKQKDARILAVFSGLAFSAGLAIAALSWPVDVFFLCLLAALLLLIESHKRLAAASRATQAANHLKTAQILLVMGVSVAYMPTTPDSDMMRGLFFSVKYGMVLMTGSFLALAYNRWRTELKKPSVKDPETDLSL